jgi:hypothetical protein
MSTHYIYNIDTRIVSAVIYSDKLSESVFDYFRKHNYDSDAYGISDDRNGLVFGTGILNVLMPYKRGKL